MESNRSLHIKIWLLRYIQVQLFITIVTLPLLVYWGLPISLMSPVSNLLFTPLLMLFLLLSSLIFFTQLLALPNHWFIIALERLTTLWSTILHYGSSCWLISFATPPKFIFFLIPIAAFALLQSRSLSSPARSSTCFALLLIITIGYLKFSCPITATVTALECNNGQLTIVRSNNQTVVIDPGVLGQRYSSNSWVEYTLISELNKQFGTSTIDHLIIMQTNKLIFEVVEKLCQCTTVKNVYLVLWQGQADRWLLRKYISLRNAIQNNQHYLKRIGNKRQLIRLSKTDRLCIKPLPEQLTYQSITFPALHITGTIADHVVDIYSKKFKKIDKKPTPS